MRLWISSALLSIALTCANHAQEPENSGAIVPKQSNWKHEVKDGKTSYKFPPHSITVLRLE